MEKIGSGGFGTVWKARDGHLGRMVAVKIPHAGPQVPPEYAQRLVREGRSASKLEHPSIVRVYEVGQEGTMPYMVCELVEGLSLSALLVHQQLDWTEVAQIIEQVATALDYAHQRGIVHRDVKPSNIMVQSLFPEDTPGPEEIQAKLMDFGISLQANVEATLMTAPGQQIGTLVYMSPEQLEDPHGVDGRTDVYSLGVVLYRLLTGSVPHRGGESIIAHKILHEHPTAPRQLRRDVPSQLEAVCVKAMAKRPEDRYGSATEMAAELRRYLSGQAVHARPVGLLGRLWMWCKRPERVKNAGVVAMVAAGGTFCFNLVGAITIIIQLSGVLAGFDPPPLLRPVEAIVWLAFWQIVFTLAVPLGYKVYRGSLVALWVANAVAIALWCFVVSVFFSVIPYDMGGIEADKHFRGAIHLVFSVLTSGVEVALASGLIAWYANRPLFDPTASRTRTGTSSLKKSRDHEPTFLPSVSHSEAPELPEAAGASGGSGASRESGASGGSGAPAGTTDDTGHRTEQV